MNVDKALFFPAHGTDRVESAHYTEKAFIVSRRFIEHALQKPVSGSGRSELALSSWAGQ